MHRGLAGSPPHFLIVEIRLPPDISRGDVGNARCPFGSVSSPLLAAGIIRRTDPGDSIRLCPCQRSSVLIDAEGDNMEFIPEDGRLLLPRTPHEL